MLLNSENYQKIAAHFGNKLPVIAYVGCWTDKTITFALYQTTEQAAGIEVTIKRPIGDNLEKVEVLQKRRLHTYRYNDRAKRYQREQLPILIF